MSASFEAAAERVWVVTTVSLVTVAATAWGASAATGLPATFLGEVAAVAVAFSLPALIAGAYLGLRRLMRGLGLKGALALSVVALCASFGWALMDARPDLFVQWAGS